MRVTLAVLMWLGVLGASAWADCVGPDGRSYPTGTRNGAVTCQPDGSWAP